MGSEREKVTVHIKKGKMKLAGKMKKGRIKEAGKGKTIKRINIIF